MSYKYRPNHAARREFAEKMREIEEFCRKNNIKRSASSDSYYFELNGTPYRVSNHTTEASDRGMYCDNPVTGEIEQVRDSYHSNDAMNTIYITAGKTRIIDIYTDLVNGFELDKRAYRKK